MIGLLARTVRLRGQWQAVSAVMDPYMVAVSAVARRVPTMVEAVVEVEAQ